MVTSLEPLCHAKRHDNIVFFTHPPKKSDWRLAWQNGYGHRPLYVNDLQMIEKKSVIGILILT